MTARAHTPPTVWSSAVRIFDLSLGQMLWSRRSVFLGVLSGGPVILAIALRIISALYASGFHINGAMAGGATIFGMMIWLLYIRFIVPVLGVFFGTALIADEVDDKTITYLFTRPRFRGAPCSSGNTSRTWFARFCSSCPRWCSSISSSFRSRAAVSAPHFLPWSRTSGC
jgi:hypothetical protein